MAPVEAYRDEWTPVSKPSMAQRLSRALCCGMHPEQLPTESGKSESKAPPPQEPKTAPKEAPPVAKPPIPPAPQPVPPPAAPEAAPEPPPAAPAAPTADPPAAPDAAEPPPAPPPPGDAAPAVETIVTAEHVTDLAALLSGPHCGKAVTLDGETVGAPLEPSPDAAAWHGTAMWPEEAESSGEYVLHELAAHGGNDEDERIVCTLTGAGTSLSGGTLQMRPDAALVLDSSCSNVTFSKVSFWAGVVVCHGSGCDVTFNDCEFNYHALVALAGARVHLVRCTFYLLIPDDEEGEDEEGDDEDEEADDEDGEEGPCPKGLSVFASGAGTCVRLTGGLMISGLQGVVVQDGAEVVARRDEGDDTLDSRLVMRDVGATALECRGAGSKLDLADVHVSGAGDRGVLGHAGGAVECVRVIVDSSHVGFWFDGTAAGRLDHCDAEGNATTGAAVKGGASVQMTACWLHDTEHGEGVYVEGGGASVRLERCCVLGNSTHAVLAENGGAATVVASCCVGEGEYELFEQTDGGTVEVVAPIENLQGELSSPALLQLCPEAAVDGDWALLKWA